MKLSMTYSVKIKRLNHIFMDTYVGLDPGGLKGKRCGLYPASLRELQGMRPYVTETREGMVPGLCAPDDREVRVCARNASRLAFDGSGQVSRGKEADDLPSYSLCRSASGKQYNCDLNASYNIGARYFIRERLKTLPATVGQAVTAKVPELAHRSTNTLSTLIRLIAELQGFTPAADGVTAG